MAINLYFSRVFLKLVLLLGLPGRTSDLLSRRLGSARPKKGKTIILFFVCIFVRSPSPRTLYRHLHPKEKQKSKRCVWNRPETSPVRKKERSRTIMSSAEGHTVVGGNLSRSKRKQEGAVGSRWSGRIPSSLLPSSRWSGKKAAHVLFVLPPRRLHGPRGSTRMLEFQIQPSSSIRTPLKPPPLQGGGRLQLKAQFQKSFGGCWKTGLPLWLASYFQAAALLVWPPALPTWPRSGRLPGTRRLPGL